MSLELSDLREFAEKSWIKLKAYINSHSGTEETINPLENVTIYKGYVTSDANELSMFVDWGKQPKNITCLDSDKHFFLSLNPDLPTGWTTLGGSEPIYTTNDSPEVGDTVYSDLACVTAISTITSVGEELENLLITEFSNLFALILSIGDDSWLSLYSRLLKLTLSPEVLSKYKADATLKDCDAVRLFGGFDMFLTISSREQFYSIFGIEEPTEISEYVCDEILALHNRLTDNYIAELTLEMDSFDTMCIAFSIFYDIADIDIHQFGLLSIYGGLYVPIGVSSSQDNPRFTLIALDNKTLKPRHVFSALLYKQIINGTPEFAIAGIGYLGSWDKLASVGGEAMYIFPVVLQYSKGNVKTNWSLVGNIGRNITFMLDEQDIGNLTQSYIESKGVDYWKLLIIENNNSIEE